MVSQDLNELRGHWAGQQVQCENSLHRLRRRRAALVQELSAPPPDSTLPKILVDFYLERERKEIQIAAIDQGIEEIKRYAKEIEQKMEEVRARQSAETLAERKKELHEKVYGSLKNNDD